MAPAVLSFEAADDGRLLRDADAEDEEDEASCNDAVADAGAVLPLLLPKKSKSSAGTAPDDAAAPPKLNSSARSSPSTPGAGESAVGGAGANPKSAPLSHAGDAADGCVSEEALPPLSWAKLPEAVEVTAATPIEDVDVDAPGALPRARRAASAAEGATGAAEDEAEAVLLAIRAAISAAVGKCACATCVACACAPAAVEAEAEAEAEAGVPFPGGPAGTVGAVPPPDSMMSCVNAERGIVTGCAGAARARGCRGGGRYVDCDNSQATVHYSAAPAAASAAPRCTPAAVPPSACLPAVSAWVMDPHA